MCYVNAKDLYQRFNRRLRGHQMLQGQGERGAEGRNSPGLKQQLPAARQYYEKAAVKRGLGTVY